MINRKRDETIVVDAPGCWQVKLYRERWYLSRLGFIKSYCGVIHIAGSFRDAENYAKDWVIAAPGQYGMPSFFERYVYVIESIMGQAMGSGDVSDAEPDEESGDIYD